MIRIINLFSAYCPRISLLSWLLVLAFGAGAFAISWRRGECFPRNEREKRALSAAALWGYAFLLLEMLALARTARESVVVILEPFRSWRKLLAGTPGSFEWGCLILFNMILFLPLGFFFALERDCCHEKAQTFGPKLLHAAAFGFCTSLLAETLQYALRRGVFEIDDLLHNTTGAVIGALLWSAISTIRRIKR